MNDKLKNFIWIFPLINIVTAELFILNGAIISAINIHFLNFLLIVLIIIFGDINIDIKRVLEGFILLILLRIANISIPKFFSVILLQYSLIYGIMFIPIYYAIKDTIEDLNINFNNIIIYLPIGIIIGMMIAVTEYIIISPIALIDKLNVSNIFLIVIIMFVFIGMVEEILFRPVLQTRLKKIIGLRYGILISGILFGVMHSGYGQINEIVFTGMIGIVIGYLFHKTRSLPFTVAIHGTTNVILFGVLPFLNK